MILNFLGTGAAEGFPAVFCNCEYCKNARLAGESQFRTRSQVLIDGCISIDFPPEAYSHSLKFGIELSKIKYILATHSHLDHFYAHDFILRGYKYAEFDSGKLEIYGNAEVKKVFEECTAREMKPQVVPLVGVRQIKPYQTFTVGDYKIITLPANHSKTEEALLFYIEKDGRGYLHLYDSGMLNADVFDFLCESGAKADAVCFDCTFADSTGKLSTRHMSINENMIIKDELLKRGVIDGKTKLIISHFSHNCNPTRAHLRLLEMRYGVVAAYDGYMVEI